MIGSKEIGGGYVRLAFWDRSQDPPQYLKAGTHLSAERISAMANGHNLIRTEHLAVYPPLPKSGRGAAMERHIVHLGRGQFDVIEGHKMNDKPLTKEEAEDLATRAEPELPTAH